MRRAAPTRRATRQDFRQDDVCACCTRSKVIELYFYGRPICPECWARECRNNNFLKKRLGIPIEPVVTLDKDGDEVKLDEADDSEASEPAPKRKIMVRFRRARV